MGYDGITAEEMRAWDLWTYVGHLSDPSGATRSRAAWELPETGDERAILPLLDMIDLDRDVTNAALAALQVIALRCLRLLGDSLALEFLSAAMKNPTLLYMRGSSPLPGLIAKALGEVGYPETARRLCAVLKEYGNERVWAAMILGEIGSPEAVAPLCIALENGNIWTRLAAVDALSGIRDKSAVTVLCRLLRNKNEETDIRARAAWALGKIGDASIVWALCEMLLKEPFETAYSAAMAVARIGGEAAVEPLLDALQLWRPNGFIAYALGEVPHPAAVEPLCEMLLGDDAEDIKEAIDALKKIGDPRALKPLWELHERTPKTINGYSARLAVMSMRFPEAVPYLCKILKGNCVNDCCVAAYMLGEIGNATAIEALSKVLVDGDVETVRAAVYALTQNGSERAIQVLQGYEGKSGNRISWYVRCRLPERVQYKDAG